MIGDKLPQPEVSELFAPPEVVEMGRQMAAVLDQMTPGYRWNIVPVEKKLNLVATLPANTAVGITKDLARHEIDLEKSTSDQSQASVTVPVTANNRDKVLAIAQKHPPTPTIQGPVVANAAVTQPTSIWKK